MNRFFKAINVMALILCLSMTLSAAVTEYTFTSAVNTYTAITGGLEFGTNTSDDQNFVDPAVPEGATGTQSGVGIPIGFNFTFNESVFDRIAINTNGWIRLGQSALTPSVTIASDYSPISNSVQTTPLQLGNVICVFGKDLQAQTDARIRVETIGSAPNQVCVIQWNNYKPYGNSYAGTSMNFQIRLYETSNKVELVYGPITFIGGTIAQAGLRGVSNADFNSRTTTTDWTAT
ncbi:MAG TPA: hypothetical protein PK816_16280, partial [Candidatus Cloacimonadota bacterium]|nr:hypothetical protein [Candidatus Cloacimonadota bacterium]